MWTMETSTRRAQRHGVRRRVGALVMAGLLSLTFTAPLVPETGAGQCNELPEPPAVLPVDGGFRGGFWGADTPTDSYYRQWITCETAPSSTSDTHSGEETTPLELLRIMLATTDQPLTTSHIVFIEENVVLPGYHPGSAASATADGSTLPSPEGRDGSQADY